MKSYCKNIDITDYKQILPFIIAWQQARRTPGHKRKMRALIERFGGLKGIAKEIAKRIKERRLDLEPIKFFERLDPSSGKLRVLGNESQFQQAFDYVAVGALMPLFKAKIGLHQYASIPKRGQVKGVRAVRKWVRWDREGTKYFDKLDIRKCFPSISHELVHNLLAKGVKNKNLLWLVDTLLSTFQDGLSIGSYLSQWLANYVLSYAYHYLQEYCYKIRRGKRIKLVKHVLFYMDDILIMGSSKRDLKMTCKRLAKSLSQIGLELKPNHNIRPLKSNSINIMGYIVYANGKAAIRAKTFIRLRRILLRRICLQHAVRFSAYYGYIKYSDSFLIKHKYDVLNKFKRMRELISRRDKDAVQIGIQRNAYRNRAIYGEWTDAALPTQECWPAGKRYRKWN